MKTDFTTLLETVYAKDDIKQSMPKMISNSLYQRWNQTVYAKDEIKQSIPKMKSNSPYQRWNQTLHSAPNSLSQTWNPTLQPFEYETILDWSQEV